MRNTLLMTISVVGAALLLAGCSFQDSGPQRDSDGRFSERTVISASDLLDGDCFSFNSEDGEVVEEATVIPCTESHDYIIIGQGKLTPSNVTSAGSLQNAVSVACGPNFDAFKATIKGDTRPKQEFMVFAETDEPDSDQLYSCISTDPDQYFIAPVETPEPTTAP